MKKKMIDIQRLQDEEYTTLMVAINKEQVVETKLIAGTKFDIMAALGLLAFNVAEVIEMHPTELLLHLIKGQAEFDMLFGEMLPSEKISKILK